jgi:hypothetical protein
VRVGVDRRESLVAVWAGRGRDGRAANLVGWSAGDPRRISVGVHVTRGLFLFVPPPILLDRELGSGGCDHAAAGWMDVCGAR